jgi:hypothetical protein
MLSVVAERIEFFVQVLRCCMCTVFLSFLGNRRPLKSLIPVSIFWTDSTCLSLCKGRKCFAARISNNEFRGCSLLLTLQEEHSVPQFSRQPLTFVESYFDFPDRLNLLSLCKGRKCFAARISDSDFESPFNRLSRPPQA